MTRLKLSDITDGKPVKLTIEIPARLHRRLLFPLWREGRASLHVLGRSLTPPEQQQQPAGRRDDERDFLARAAHV